MFRQFPVSSRNLFAGQDEKMLPDSHLARAKVERHLLYWLAFKI